MPAVPTAKFGRIGRWLFDQPYLLLPLTSLFWACNTVLGPLRGRAHSADDARLRALGRGVFDRLAICQPVTLRSIGRSSASTPA